MGKAIERMFLPLMRLQAPEIVDVSMPAEGIFHNLMLVSIRKSYAGQARKVMNAIWGMGQASFTKMHRRLWTTMSTCRTIRGQPGGR